MNTNDPKIQQAIALLRDFERAKTACMDFLKTENSYSSDPIGLKLWLADRIAAENSAQAADQQKDAA